MSDNFHGLVAEFGLKYGYSASDVERMIERGLVVKFDGLTGPILLWPEGMTAADGMAAWRVLRRIA